MGLAHRVFRSGLVLKSAPELEEPKGPEVQLFISDCRCQRHEAYKATLHVGDLEYWLAFSWVEQNQYGLEYPAALQDYRDLSLFFFSLSSYNAMFYNPIHAMPCWVKVPQSSHYFTLNIALLGHYPDD